VLQQFSPIDGFEADTFRLRESDFIVDGMEYSMGRRRDETSGVPTPDSMYGLAKTLGEYLALNAREYGLKVHVVRPFSGYGEAQSLSYPLPSIVKRAIDGEPLVWGPPEQARDWIHVDDVVRGAMAVVSADHEEAVNLCTGEPTTMGGVLARAWSAARGTALADDAIQYDLEKPTGVLYRVGDPTEMRKYYTPTVGLDEGIDRAVKYMKRM
jgi:nucleoside-diphosphate-sugar epimerase